MPTLGAVIRQLRDEGWAPKYGDNEVRLTLDHRAIWVFGNGRVELEDDRAPELNGGHLPGREDYRWSYALGILGLDRNRVNFDPRTRKWASSLLRR